MASGFIRVAPDSTGKLVDNSELTVGANLVERQRIVIADDLIAGAIAPVTLAGGLLINGAVTVAALDTNLSGIKTGTDRIPALGQAVAASAVPVVLTAIQQTALTPPAAIAGFALEAGHLATIDANLPAKGQALAAASMPVVLTAIQIAAITPDVALSTRLKPADTLTGVTTVAAVTAITNALPAGTNRIGSMRQVDSADADMTSAKFAQTARFLGVQRSIDAGRNTRIFMLDTYAAVTNADAVVNVVQWYGNAAVGATAQPAVVPAGKTLRLTSWKMFYQSLVTTGFAVVRIRCNVAGLGVLASPLVFSFEAGSSSAVAGVCMTEAGDFPEGLEIPAAAGLAFSVAGYGPAGVLTAEGGIRFMVTGYEY